MLEQFLAALERMPGGWPTDELRRCFARIAQRHPVLVVRAKAAERAADSVAVELVVREIVSLLLDDADEFEADAGIVSGLSALRFNHSRKRIHQGHGSRSVPLFLVAESGDQPN